MQVIQQELVTRSRLHGLPVMRKVILFITTFWIIMYSNARMSDFVPSYKFVHLFPIPAFVRGVELALLVFLYLLSLTTKMNKRILLFNVSILAFIGLSILNLVWHGNLRGASIQDLYIRLAPLLFFAILVPASRADKKELRFFVQFFIGTLLLNILVSVFYQIPLHGDHEDHIPGIMEDAHAYCNYLLVFFIVLLYDYLRTKKLSSLALSLFFLVLTVFPRNEKAIGFTILVAGILVLQHILKKTKGLFLKLAIVGTLLLATGIGTVTLVKNRPDIWARADLAINYIGLENVGPIQAWPMAVNEIQSGPMPMLIGLGAGEYGWIAAGRDVSEGNGRKHSRQFDFEFTFGSVDNAGFMFRTNTWSSLLAEFGMLGTLLFLVPVWIMTKKVWKHQPENRLEANMRMAFLIILLLVVFQGFFTPYSNWSSPTLVFPMAYLAAYFHSTTKKELPENS